jgi:hypothetical protein
VALEGRTGIRKMKRILKHDIQSNLPLQTGFVPGKEIWVRFTIPSGVVHVCANH